MDPTRRPGLELVLPAPVSPMAFEALVTTVQAAEAAGFATVWLASRGPGAPDVAALAGGLVPATSTVGLGVVAGLLAGRHPSVTAREVTTLDVMSDGRAAVLFEWGRRGSAEDAVPGDEVAGRLREAARICSGLFRSEVTTYDGRFYRVEGAVNRPGPVQPGGPGLLVELRDHGVPEGVDAVVGAGGPAEVRAARTLLNGSVAAPDGERPRLVWRVPVSGEPAERTATSLAGLGVDAVTWQLDLAAGAADRVATLAGQLGLTAGERCR